MSRHRYVKNLNIKDELDDDALSDGVDEEEMTTEQQLQMNDVLEEIRNVIGEEEISGLPDSEIKETIWYYNFDISESIQWCLDQQEKRRATKERQGIDRTPSSKGNHYAGMQKYGEDTSDLGIGGRSRMPLIHLAQQQQQMMEQQQRHQQWEQQRQQMLQEEPEQIVVGEENEQNLENVDDESTRRLSTISERTERTELPPYRPRRDYLPPPRTVSTFTNSSYGNLIDGGYLMNPARLPSDPNLIPVSPSGSAIHRLSTYEPAPSITSSGSYRQSSPPRPPSEPIPPLDTIPDIPDSQSSVVPPPLPPKSIKQSSPVKLTASSVQQASPSQPPVKQSKLAQLASSRASTRTTSSASLSTEASNSIKTDSALRPLSSSSSSSTATALPVPPPDHHSMSRVSSPSVSMAKPVPSPLQRSDRIRDTIASSLPSSTSFDVQKAVDAALELEALDRELAASRSAKVPLEKKSPMEPSQPDSSARPAAPTPSKVAGAVSSSTTTLQSTRPPSKLALLAQAKAQRTEAQKAISKAPRARPPPPNHLPPEHTEYLIPIANGSSVTTAITTSYQTLYSLTDPSRSQVTEAPFVVPLTTPNYIKGVASSASSNASATTTKPPSKLALKAKKAQEKNSTPSHSSVDQSEPEVIMVPTMFLPKSTRSSASPSAFASVLVDVDLINSPQVNAGTSRRNSKGRQSAASETTEGQSTLDMPRTYHRQRRIAPSLGTPTTASSFAFDGPSPDDIVFNARRGTSLSQRKDRKDIPSTASTINKKSSTSKT
ncbi:hypothetical protein F5050DRAFT_1810344 [Lentinula boryana]|uniref:HBS1-like protein N-terminal domain-containing protein n=1 Tax=Lentinula boryana TaxID=40481 RepID=A0ABQ8Q458_9AGAR|nr:hypothetical protein F5050DRAFT_1810344 [Lentinula boryana]